MNKARIENTNEIVKADTLLKFYPNYSDLIFVCIDEKCSIRMAPTCIKKTERKKPHFKKYRNREHIETCEYATLSELYQKGKNQKLNKIEINKIGYPSVFNLNENKGDDVEKKSSQAKLDDGDEGVTGRGGGISKVYEFDSENIKFDRSNKVQSVDRIVDWYLGFPHNRDVQIEINDKKIQYRYFFKRIIDNTDPLSLQNDRIFYGKIMLSETNKNVFNKYTESVFLTLLGFKKKDELENKIYNYSVKIDKKSISKRMLSRLRNKYESLFEEAHLDLKNGSNEPNVGLYVFVYGSIDENNDTILNVKQHHITFRYDEVRKTTIE
ncbi:hypothetical protein FLSI110296_13640 [Flavobacterium sinopsychrotolerans]|jgi:hypothetical protein|uniref:Uncharacterized protein n=1 Tax=Flavobacterium sinopsychrotolerans TaxID=604089 RepID=A0A1H8NND4_9FLAO|nr:hypothetical protein [Flavobacterium sinopsychrotolerans]SEO31241.1 hypothetical protein SAMN04487942_2389 [Flavobacterium sinopsychrotolerans]